MRKLVRKGQEGISTDIFDPYSSVYNMSIGTNSQSQKNLINSLFSQEMGQKTSDYIQEGVGGSLEAATIAPPSELENVTIPTQVFETGTEDPSSFTDKFNNSTFGKNFGLWNAGLNIGNSIMTGIVGNKMYGGKYGSLVKGIDTGVNMIADGLSLVPGGQVFSLGLKGLSLANKGANALLGKLATDNKTAGDAWMNNPITGVVTNTINSIFGENAHTITEDRETRSLVGSDYGSTFNKVDKALEDSGARFGLVSKGALRDTNKRIDEAHNEMITAGYVADNAMDRFNLKYNMSDINGARYAQKATGGYRQSAVSFGREGMVIAKRVASKYKANGRKNSLSKQLVEEFKEGGQISTVLLEISTDPSPEEFKEGGILYPASTIEEIIVEELVEEFKEGGSFNVIPEGALHARLHHMDNADNLTKKGIPVVSETDTGELEQHAEIEREEIILRLSLTKRLEELAKEDTDEAAIEAGKILVEEILNNTIDNTNKLL